MFLSTILNVANTKKYLVFHGLIIWLGRENTCVKIYNDIGYLVEIAGGKHKINV